MNSIIILLSLALLYILYYVQSIRAVELFRAACPTTIRKNCNKKLIANALNDMNTRLFKLRKVIADDTRHIEYDKMYDWYMNKTSLNNVVLNKPHLKNTQSLIKKANRDYIKMKNQLNKPSDTTNRKYNTNTTDTTNNESIPEHSTLVNNLVQDNIHNSVKNKQYVELLDEWADIKKESIIESTKKYKRRLEKIQKMNINRSKLSTRRQTLIRTARHKPNSIMELNKVRRMSDEDIANNIKLELSRPIFKQAKAYAKIIATVMNKTAPQLKREIILMKRLRMQKIEDEYGPS